MNVESSAKKRFRPTEGATPRYPQVETTPPTRRELLIAIATFSSAALLGLGACDNEWSTGGVSDMADLHPADAGDSGPDSTDDSGPDAPPDSTFDLREERDLQDAADSGPADTNRFE